EQSGENVVGVLAKQRRATILDAETVHLPRQAKLAVRPRVRMIYGAHAAVGLELRVIQQLIAAHDRTGRHARGLQRVDRLANSNPPSQFLDGGGESADMGEEGVC